jgi:hypothetical protein
LIARNVEQFCHAGATPFGYTSLGKLDSSMAQAVYDVNLEHNTLINSAIQAIVKKLFKHPAIDKILTPVVTPEDFKSAFK